MNSIQETINDIKANALYHGNMAGVTPDSKKMDTSVKGRIIPSLIAGFAGLTGSYILPKTLLKINPSPAMVGALTMAGLGAGYFSPDIYNATLDANRNKISKKEAIDIIKQIESRQSMVNEKSNEVGRYYDELAKSASITGTLLKGGIAGVKHLTKGVIGGSRLWAQGMAPVDKVAPIGAKAFGLATKGVTIGGVGYGGYSAHKAFTAPKSGSNYSTMLRNNVLSGNVRVNELSPTDASQIQKLGLR
jgi:hypothetical protein